MERSMRYDAGKVEATVAGVSLELEEPVLQVLFYPAKDCVVALNGEDKEVFLPAECWTPILATVEKFTLKASEDCDVYWHGYFRVRSA